jgi:drug/metabolite transporter (DMT)-like permease
MTEKKKGLRIEYFLMLIVSFFWAIGHPLGRILLQKVHPLQLGTVTLVSGFIGLLVFLTASGKVRQVFKLSLCDALISMGLGVFGFFLYQILTFSALSRIPASMNAVLVSSNVVFIALLAALILKERVGPIRIIGMILAVCGVVLVTFNKGFSIGDGGGSIDLLFLLPACGPVSRTVFGNWKESTCNKRSSDCCSACNIFRSGFTDNSYRCHGRLLRGISGRLGHNPAYGISWYYHDWNCLSTLVCLS